jgi:hypothetical protein
MGLIDDIFGGGGSSSSTTSSVTNIDDERRVNTLEQGGAQNSQAVSDVSGVVNITSSDPVIAAQAIKDSSSVAKKSLDAVTSGINATKDSFITFANKLDNINTESLDFGAFVGSKAIDAVRSANDRATAVVQNASTRAIESATGLARERQLGGDNTIVRNLIIASTILGVGIILFRNKK